MSPKKAATSAASPTKKTSHLPPETAAMPSASKRPKTAVPIPHQIPGSGSKHVTPWRQSQSSPGSSSSSPKSSSGAAAFLRRYSLPSVRPKTAGNAGGVATDFDISRFPLQQPVEYGSPHPLIAQPCELDGSLPIPAIFPSGSAPSAGRVLMDTRATTPAIIRPMTVVGTLSSRPLSPPQGAFGSPAARAGSPTINPAVVFPPARIRFPRNFTSPPPSAREACDVFPERRPSTAKLAEWKFRRSIFADEFHFVITEKGLIQPAGLPSRKPLSESGIAAWDPEQTGSYPPRPIDMFMFNTIKYHHLQLIQVEDMTPDVMAHKPQPETDVQPAEGRPVKGLSWVDVQGIPHRIAQPLELFDNPELDLVHPSLDILEVNSISSSCPQKLQINSPLAFASPPTCCLFVVV